MSKATTFLAVAGWLIFISTSFMLWQYSVGGWPFAEVIRSESCQYPTRELKDGECDNSDPAVPEQIKEEPPKPQAELIEQVPAVPEIQQYFDPNPAPEGK